MIPKNIWTYWINEDPNSMPELTKECIETQKKMCNDFAYEHRLLTIDDCHVGSKYVDECLSRHDVVGYVKASDYLRVWYVWKYGGFALDGDMEIIKGKNFDDLLDCEMFTSRECAGLLANAAFGAVAGHPFLKDYLDILDTNFNGSGNMVFEPGIRAFDDLLWYYKKDNKDPKMVILPTDYFFPYSHISGQTNITPNTRVIHKYAKSWLSH